MKNVFSLLVSNLPILAFAVLFGILISRFLMKRKIAGCLSGDYSLQISKYAYLSRLDERLVWALLLESDLILKKQYHLGCIARLLVSRLSGDLPCCSAEEQRTFSEFKEIADEIPKEWFFFRINLAYYWGTFISDPDQYVEIKRKIEIATESQLATFLPFFEQLLAVLDVRTKETEELISLTLLRCRETVSA